MAMTDEQNASIAQYWAANQGDPGQVMAAMSQYGVSAADLAAATGQDLSAVSGYLASNGAAAGFGGVNDYTSGGTDPAPGTPVTGGVDPVKAAGYNPYVTGGSGAPTAGTRVGQPITATNPFGANQTNNSTYDPSKVNPTDPNTWAVKFTNPDGSARTLSQQEIDYFGPQMAEHARGEVARNATLTAQGYTVDAFGNVTGYPSGAAAGSANNSPFVTGGAGVPASAPAATGAAKDAAMTYPGIGANQFGSGAPHTGFTAEQNNTIKSAWSDFASGKRSAASLMADMTKFGVNIADISALTGLPADQVIARLSGTNGAGTSMLSPGVNPSSGTPGGLISSNLPASTGAVAPPPVAQVTAGTVAPVANVTAQNAAFTAASPAAQATTSQVSVDGNQLVENRLNNIIAADSPLQQQARAAAVDAANTKGLVNSSMAVGAAQGAVMQNALPIAQADAGTYAQAARQNASELNNTSQFNAGQTNTVNTFNAGQANTAAQFNSSQTLKAEQGNQAVQQQSAVANLQASMQASVANAAAQNQQGMAVLNAELTKQVNAIDNQYKMQIQATASLGTAYQQMIAAYTSILTDPNITDPAVKQQQINQITNTYKGLFNFYKTSAGLTGNLLDFDTPSTGATTGTTGGTEANPTATSSSSTSSGVVSNGGGGDGGAGDNGDAN